LWKEEYTRNDRNRLIATRLCGGKLEGSKKKRLREGRAASNTIQIQIVT
jgi:hypothetical protein